VTPETTEHLDRAREHLTKARNLLHVMHTMTMPGALPIWPGFTLRKR
jgi:hypothetical protein